MIAIYRIPLHDAFLYSILDPEKPHPDTLDKEGSLVHAVYLNKAGKVALIENYGGDGCTSVREFEYSGEKTVREKEVFPETEGVNEIVYSYDDSGYTKEYFTNGELDFREMYTQSREGKPVAYMKLDAGGKILEQFRMSAQGDITFLQNHDGETSYEIKYDDRGRKNSVYHEEKGIGITEKYFYEGNSCVKMEVYENDELVAVHEIEEDKQTNRVCERVYIKNILISENLLEDNRKEGYFLQIRTIMDPSALEYTRNRADSRKCEIRFGKDGIITELLSSNDRFIDPALLISFEPDAYYFLETGED
ncbi:MAG: hypothetical protein EHM28_07860 [Spirochaetaceae bacterium]|nr:MAG: hypothetical protein EHM28_07860 [Spirochaetaceae bacterium]